MVQRKCHFNDFGFPGLGKKHRGAEKEKNTKGARRISKTTHIHRKKL